MISEAGSRKQFLKISINQIFGCDGTTNDCSGGNVKNSLSFFTKNDLVLDVFKSKMNYMQKKIKQLNVILEDFV